MSTGPAGMSRRNLVSGSTIGMTPVSSNTVAMHIVLEPDIGGYSVGSMMIAPAAQSSRVDGTMQVDVSSDRTARLADQHATDVVVIAFERQLLGHHRVAGRR